MTEIKNMDYRDKINPIIEGLKEAIRLLDNASKMSYSAEFKATVSDAENYIEYAQTDIRYLQRKT